MSQITKTVFPVAGLVRRFLPAIKAGPNSRLNATRACGLAKPEVGGGLAVHLDNPERTRVKPRGRAPSPALA